MSHRYPGEQQPRTRGNLHLLWELTVIAAAITMFMQIMYTTEAGIPWPWAAPFQAAVLIAAAVRAANC